MIAIFRNTIFRIGGIESWLYYLAKTYKDTHNITIYYKQADPEQLKRLRKLVRCVEYSDQEVDCDVAVFCYDMMGFKNTNAKRKVHIVHADYNEIRLNLDIPDGMDEIYAVSEVAQKSFKEVMGVDCGLLYNPVNIDKPDKVLRLISATRLTSEKGYLRMKRLAETLDDLGVKYTWDIYTNETVKNFSPNVSFKQPKLDIIPYIAASDYLVQLSDTESFGYSIVESLTLGVPVIVTDMPVIRELGVTEENGIILGLKEDDYTEKVKDIAKKAFNFKYTAPKSDWSKVFGKKSKSDYEYKEYKVKNISVKTYFTEEGLTVDNGGTFAVMGKDRLDALMASGHVELIKDKL